MIVMLDLFGVLDIVQGGDSSCQRRAVGIEGDAEALHRLKDSLGCEHPADAQGRESIKL